MSGRESNELEKKCYRRLVTIWILIFCIGFISGFYFVEKEKVKSMKLTVISYDYENGSRQLIEQIKKY